MPTVEISPSTKDTWVDSYSSRAGINYGSNSVIKAEHSAPYDKFPLIQIGKDVVPAGATVISDIVYLYCLAGGSNETVEICKLEADWDEMTATFNNRPNIAGYGIYANTVEIGQVMAINITQLSQAWANGSFPDYGFSFGGSGVGYYLDEFASRHYPDPAKWPLRICTWNFAPTVPTNLSPAGGEGINPSEDNLFEWQHNDPDDDDQIAYQMIIYRVSDGATILDTGKISSAQQFRTIAAGVLAAGVEYQWKVRTWDIYNAVSPYSGLQSFYASTSPGAVITTPSADYAEVGVSNLTVEWTFSDPDTGDSQSAFHVILRNSIDTETLYDSGKVTSTSARSHLIDYELHDDTDYKIKLTLYDSSDTPSSQEVRIFTANLSYPSQPVMTLSANTGNVGVSIDNPTPGVGEPAVDHNEVFRRKTGETSWVKIATNIANDGSYSDYTCPFKDQYEYKVRTWGVNSVYRDSEVSSITITTRFLYVHDVTDPAGTLLELPYRSDTSENWAPEVAKLKYAGRRRPVIQYGEMAEYDYACKVQLIKGSQLHTDYEALMRSLSQLCIRDSRGRRVFGGIAEPLSSADTSYGYEIDLKISENGYDEAV
jgi:hypothetical protein